MQASSEISPFTDIEPATALVAEDEVILRMTLADHLRAAGFHVLEAANGGEARKIMTAVEHVDVVISDVHMADREEGFELARWLGEHYPAIPVILTSGSRGAAESGAWRESQNVTDFIGKPYSVPEMERVARSRLKITDAPSD